MYKMCEIWVKIGNKWSDIAKSLNRTEYWVKKSWRLLLKKAGIQTRKRLDTIRAIEMLMAKIHVLQSQTEDSSLPHTRPGYSFDQKDTQASNITNPDPEKKLVDENHMADEISSDLVFLVPPESKPWNTIERLSRCNDDIFDLASSYPNMN